MELYPWRFDSIHSHCHEDGIIFYSILTEFELTRTSATRSKNVRVSGTSPYILWITRGDPLGPPRYQNRHKRFNSNKSHDRFVTRYQD
jgi:hypothetical protein